MSSSAFIDGQLVITYGDRVVATTGGTLLQFLTQEQTFVTNLVYPSPPQYEGYSWNYNARRAPGSNFRIVTTAMSYVLAAAGEWTSEIDLGPVPAGADLFVGRATFSRSVEPAATWIGQNLVPVIPMDVDIQLTGSVLVEAAMAISRAVSIYIEDGRLVALLEQSVGPVAGNFGNFGDYPPIEQPPNLSDDTRSGGRNHGPAGVPVWWSESSPYRRVRAFEGEGDFGPGSWRSIVRAANETNKGGDDDASYPGAKNYSSTYALIVRGRFGRRS